MPKSALVYVLLSILLIASEMQAQNVVSTGALSGRVTDPSSAVIANASVTLTNNATAASSTTTTNQSGLYRFPVLAVGNYSLKVGHAGFRTTEVRSIVIEVGHNAAQDVELQLGMAAESVSVTATTPLLRPEESTLSTVVDQKLIEELPLSGRRYTDFVLLTPNANADGQFGQVSIGGQQGGADSGYANGNGSNSFTVDGANATSGFFGDARGRTRVPFVFGENAIQEFQVADSPYSAVYGGAGSGFINTVTKSGSNNFHGNAFYYNRNSGTGAEDAIDKGQHRPKPLDVLQQFGAGVGGPIVRNKLFFFFDYEQQRQKNPISVINLGMQGVDQTSFGVPANVTLPAPNAPFPVPNADASPDPTNPIYLQQVSNAVNAIRSNLGLRPRFRNTLAFFSKVDWELGSKDRLTFSQNYNKFDSPGGEITFNPASAEGIQALSNNFVRDHHYSVAWTHTISNNLLNDFHVAYLRDEQLQSPSGLVDPNFPQIEFFGPQFFFLGNPTFSTGDTKEFQWEIADGMSYVRGKHNLKFGIEFNRTHVTDFFFGNFRGTYAFANPTNFALGQYNFFTQSTGNPTFPFTFPFYGFYVQDKFQVSPKLTLDLGLREDFQVFPQPRLNPVFPLTGQFPNQYQRLSPRIGLSYQPFQKTIIRGGFGMFHEVFNGINYESSVISNGLRSQQSSTFVPFAKGTIPNAQVPVFPNILSNTGSFLASSNLSIVDPNFQTPYILQSSLQIERELIPNTTLSIGTMWTHGVHLISSSAFDLNLKPPTGSTTYVVCPVATTTLPCSGPTIAGPTLDAGLLSEGRINSSLGQINALISPGINNYNSFFAQLQRRVAQGLSLQAAYTFSKNIVSNGVDFNNQFDFRNTHAPSLLDQRHRLSVAAVYQPVVGESISTPWARSALSNWTISTVIQFASGRPYAALLNSTCTSSTLDFNNCDGGNNQLNNSAANESTSNTAAGIIGTGLSPTVGLNSFYGPWTEEVDLAIARRFHITERHTVTLEAQVFNLMNHANYFVQAGSGINQNQFNPIGANCGDGSTPNQTCFLVPNSGPGNFKALQSINELNGPRVFQFAFKYSF